MSTVRYLRQSLDKNNDELGIGRQDTATDQLCSTRGWRYTDTITDNDTSAAKRGGRKGYLSLVERIRSGEITRIVILRIDRLLRLSDELEELIQLVEQTGLHVATVEGEIDLATPGGRLVARILVSVAQAEIETKSARHKLANEQKAQAGKPHGSRRPYGYEADLLTKKQDEADVLRAMADRVVSGQSYKEVAWWANAEGHRTTLGKLWYPITVRNMLQKVRYVGLREYADAVYSGNWDPIFTLQEWERLQLAIRVRREAVIDRPAARKYMLTGLVECGSCGMPLNGATKRDRPDRPIRRTYHCRVVGDAKRERGCGGVVRNADALEHWVFSSVIRRVGTGEAAAAISSGSEKSDVELRALLDERAALRDRLNELVDDYSTAVLSKAEYVRAKGKANARLDEVNAVIDELSRAGLASSIIPAGQTFASAWDGSVSDDHRRTLLSLYIDKIKLMPGVTKPYYPELGVLLNGTQQRFDPALVRIAWKH